MFMTEYYDVLKHVNIVPVGICSSLVSVVKFSPWGLPLTESLASTRISYVHTVSFPSNEINILMWIKIKT